MQADDALLASVVGCNCSGNDFCVGRRTRWSALAGLIGLETFNQRRLIRLNHDDPGLFLFQEALVDQVLDESDQAVVKAIDVQ